MPLADLHNWHSINRRLWCRRWSTAIVLSELLDQIIQPRANKVVRRIALAYPNPWSTTKEHVKHAVILIHVNRRELAMKHQQGATFAVPSCCSQHPLPHQRCHSFHHLEMTVIIARISNQSERIHDIVMHLVEFLHKARTTVGA